MAHPLNHNWFAAHELGYNKRSQKPSDYQRAQLHQHVCVAKAPPRPLFHVSAHKDDHTDDRDEDDAILIREPACLQQQVCCEQRHDELGEKLDDQRFPP
jgi:hypothetical protein